MMETPNASVKSSDPRESVIQKAPDLRRETIGVLKHDWIQTTAGSIATKIGSGVTPTGGNIRYQEYGRPFVRSQNVGWGRLILEDLVFINEETHCEFPATELKLDDVLLNITGASIGRTALANERLVGGNVNQHVCIIRSAPTLAVPRLINQILLSKLGQRQIDSFQAGGNRQGLNFAQVASIKLSLPPTLAEQQAIAEALSDADALIESLEQLIAKKRQIKQGAMQELLTGKRRLPGFSREWAVKRLGDIAEMASGGTPPSSNPAFYDGDVPWVSISDITKSGKTINATERNLTGAGFSNSAAQMFPMGTVLYAMYASLGECSLAGVPLCSSQAILGIKPKASLDNEFLYFYLTQQKRTVQAMGQHGTQSNLNKGIVQAFELRLPPVDEQRAIASILRDVDDEITEVEARLAKARQLKQGMMQELLTGRIRLI